MSLVSLAGLDRAAANTILAATAISTAPNPSDAKQDWWEKYLNHITAVSSEIRQRLNLTVEELSNEDRARFDEFLAKQISETNFESREQSQAALFRAGQAGLLAPSAYEVEQPKEFVQAFRRLGFSKNLVEDIIAEPDELQHLLPDDDKEKERDATVFLKKYKKGKHPHWMLVQTQRVGAKLVMQSAWRIFPEHVDLSHAQRPIDLLRALVSVFGLPIKVGGKAAKFIECETFYDLPDTAGVPISFDKPNSVREVFSSFAWKRTENVLKVGIAYCVNMDQYLAAVAQLGFVVRERK